MSSLSKFAFTGAFALLLLSAAAPAQAQVNININSPSWGPAAPAGTQYYYIPEAGGYYDLRDKHYVVQREGKWQRVTTITSYNPSSFHPVVINYVGAQPWVLIREHKVKYPKAGHPHGMPPGQAKKMRAAYPAGNVIVVQQGGGHPGKGHGGGGKGHGKGKH